MSRPRHRRIRTAPWPRGLPACMRCMTPASECLYVRRGLCHACYTQERRRRSLDDWPRVKRPYNPTLALAEYYGVTECARRCRVNIDILRAWAATETPPSHFELVHGHVLEAYAEQAARARSYGHIDRDTESRWSDDDDEA